MRKLGVAPARGEYGGGGGRARENGEGFEHGGHGGERVFGYCYHLSNVRTKMRVETNDQFNAIFMDFIPAGCTNGNMPCQHYL